MKEDPRDLLLEIKDLTVEYHTDDDIIKAVNHIDLKYYVQGSAFSDVTDGMD